MKILILIICLALTAMFVACSGSVNQNINVETKKDPNETERIPFCSVIDKSFYY